MRLLTVSLLTVLTACSNTGFEAPQLQEAQLEGRSGLFQTGSAAERALAEELAYTHLDEQAERFLDGIDMLDTRMVQIVDGEAHVRIQQFVDGVRVLGGESIVHLTETGEVSTVTDRWQRQIDIPVIPTLLKGTAKDIARLAAGFSSPESEEPETELLVINHEGEDHLVFRVQLFNLDGTERTSMPVVMVDAHSGDVVYTYDNLQTIEGHATTDNNGSITFETGSYGGGYALHSAEHNVGTYTFGNANLNRDWIYASDLDEVTSTSTDWTYADEVAVDAHYGAQMAVDYYIEKHSREGINNNYGPTLKDGMLTSGVHYGNSYVNAFWNGTAMVYGDGDGWNFKPLVSLDVVGHELTHGVTGNTARLIYKDESGALNESMSDVFGTLIEAYADGNNPNIWKIGEDIYTPNTSGDAMRYMSDPARAGDTDHYAYRYVGSADRGGVHSNSGIGNLAFYLVSEGGLHPRRNSVTDVVGIGLDKAGKIWYKALTQYMSETTDFHEAREDLIQAATALYGADSQEVASVANAWAQVGVGAVVANPSDSTDPTGPTDPAPTGDGDLSVTDIASDAGTEKTYTVEIPEGATDMTIRISGGTGDADLYVNLGDAGTDNTYLCRPYKSGNEELCEFAAPEAGTYYMRVKAYASYTGVTLSVNWTAPVVETPEPTEPDSLSEAIEGGTDSKSYFNLEVPEGASSVSFVMEGGTGDADLYVRHGDAPDFQTYDCRPWLTGNNETCTISNPTAGTWYVMVHGYEAFAGATLTGVSE